MFFFQKEKQRCSFEVVSSVTLKKYYEAHTHIHFNCYYFIFQLYSCGVYAITFSNVFWELHELWTLWWQLCKNFKYNAFFFHFFNVLTIVALAILFCLPLGKKISLLCCCYSAVGNVFALSSEKKSVDLTLLKYLSMLFMV